MKKNAPKFKIVTEISYRIFECNDEGHLKEPTQIGYHGDEHIFNHWNGYPSFDEATRDIIDHANTHGTGTQYVILPFVTTRTEEIADYENTP